MFLQTLRKHIYFYSFSLEDIFENSNDLFSLKMKEKSSLDMVFAKKEDNLSLKIFLENLGRTDKAEQISNIDNETRYCDLRIKEEQEILKEKTKLNLIFYSFIGLAISLILV